MVPEPPVPAVTLTVSVWPAQTLTPAGFMVITGATGNATIVQLTTTGVEVVQPDPVAVR